MNKSGTSIALIALFLASLMAPTAIADSPPTFSIHAAWTADADEIPLHAYHFKFDNAVNSTSETFTAYFEHTDESGTLIDSGNGILSFVDDRTLQLVLNDTMGFGDEILIRGSWSSGITTERTIEVTVWNQPLADHEVTITTQWNLDHSYEDENGSQRYLLTFDGRGWQERTGDTLRAWELGDGVLSVREHGENETTWINLTMDSIWRNETTVAGVLSQQDFEADGHGDIVLVIHSPDMDNLRIEGIVDEANFSRRMLDGIVTESAELEAYGILNGTNHDEDEDSSLWMNGSISLLYFKRIEVDGEIAYDINRFQGFADMEMEDEDSRMLINIDSIEAMEEWQDGVRIAQRNHIEGDGVFGFSGDDEDNNSFQVNGTVHSLRETSVNGEKTDSYFHMDGTFEGDVEGTFGALNRIETSGEWQNHNDTTFPVNVILEESWLNLTGAGGFGFNTGGSNHNKTWNYETPYIEWENATIFRKWESTGFDNDKGDEYPENSPLQNPPSPPETEDGLGEVNLSRESGLVPVPLLIGDRVSLTDSENALLDIEAVSTGTLSKDGHLLSTTSWTGVYRNLDGSTASGNVVNEGPLAGINAQVTRNMAIPGANGEPAEFTEAQSLERVLSPSIVASNENTAPQIVDIRLRGGLVNEGGQMAHLEVVVNDPDWNVEEVVVDLSALGMGGTVTLNDKGQDGDTTIHDDIWTTEVVVEGAIHGEVSISTTVSDVWGAEGTADGVIDVYNQAPRLTGWTHVPSQVQRGDTLVVNAEVYDMNGVAKVAVDLRDEGGELHQLTEDEVAGNWAGVVPIPAGMDPGTQTLSVYLEDDDGSSISVESTQGSGSHYTPSESDIPITILVLNSGPTISEPTLSEDSITVVSEGDGETYLMTVKVEDEDGVRWVKVDLGNLAPPGSATSWMVMYDNGQNGDETAGDGIYSVEFDSRRGLPKGGYPITFKAQDSHSAESTHDEWVIRITEAEETTLDPDGVFAALGGTGVILGVIGLVAGIMLILGVVSFLRRRAENKDNPWTGKVEGNDPWGNQ